MRAGHSGRGQGRRMPWARQMSVIHPKCEECARGCLLVSPKLNGAQIIRAFLHSVTPGVSNSASDPQSSSFGFSFSLFFFCCFLLCSTSQFSCTSSEYVGSGYLCAAHPPKGLDSLCAVRELIGEISSRLVTVVSYSAPFLHVTLETLKVCRFVPMIVLKVIFTCCKDGAFVSSHSSLPPQ